jgi:hypothetical protein
MKLGAGQPPILASAERRSENLRSADRGRLGQPGRAFVVRRS